MSNLPHVPEGYHTVTPSLTSKDADAAIKFYEAAFDAVEHFRLTDELTGGIAHAEFRIGDSPLMISDEYPELGSFAPEEGKGGLFMVYVPDCDTVFGQAIAAGATVVTEPTNQFWGDRTAMVTDPFGYRWTIAEKIASLTPEEIQAGMKNYAEA